MKMTWIIPAAVLTLAGAMQAEACAGCGCRDAKKSTVKKAATDHVAGHKDHGYQVVDTAAVEKAVAGKAVIVDARGGKYLDDRRIPGATALAADSSDAEIAKALPDKNAEIVAYCSNTKCPASKTLANKLVLLGYTNIKKYPDGIDGWETAGKTVEKAVK